MTVDIFAYPFGFTIERGCICGEPVHGPIYTRYHKYMKGNKIKRRPIILKDFIPETCKAINLYCDTDTPLDQVMNVVSYVYSINTALTIHTYDSELEGIDDWSKINNNIKFNVDIVF